MPLNGFVEFFLYFAMTFLMLFVCFFECRMAVECCLLFCLIHLWLQYLIPSQLEWLNGFLSNYKFYCVTKTDVQCAKNVSNYY